MGFQAEKINEICKNAPFRENFMEKLRKRFEILENGDILWIEKTF